MPIRPLPPEVVRQIAAGEVVDRPASLVKELLENSLDAGALRLLLECEQGGLARLRLTDDGQGIRQEDIAHLLQRHSTSKLAAIEGLHAIGTLGFRGEALYSIAAVTRFHLWTRHVEEELGTELYRDDDLGLVLKPWVGPAGTSIEAADLFYNIPARRKFCKSPTAEYTRIAALITRYALAWPDRAFELRHNGRRTFHALGTGPLEALRAAYGAQTAAVLLPVEWSAPGVLITGFVSPPGEGRGTRSEQTFFLNGRWIRDNALHLALERAYGVRLPAGRHPIAVLRLEVPPEEVDVNVHPHKTEVRFADSSAIVRAVQRACEAALGAQVWVRPELTQELPAADQPVRTNEAPDWLEEPPLPPVPPPEPEALPWRWAPNSVEEYTEQSVVEPIAVAPATVTPQIDPDTGEVTFPPLTTALPALPDPATLPALVSGTWITLPGGRIALAWDDALWLIDLARLHARILYETLASAPAGSVLEQPLLFPQPLDLTPATRARLEELQPQLAAIGFRFDADSTHLEGAPSVLGSGDPVALLRTLLESQPDDALPGSDPLDALRRRAALQVARQMADRSSRTRSASELSWLLEHLRDYRYFTDPAGHPAVLRCDADWLRSLFGGVRGVAEGCSALDDSDTSRNLPIYHPPNHLTHPPNPPPNVLADWRPLASGRGEPDTAALTIA